MTPARLGQNRGVLDLIVLGVEQCKFKPRPLQIFETNLKYILRPIPHLNAQASQASSFSSEGLTLLLVSQITQPIRAKAKPLLLPILSRDWCVRVCM